MDAAEQDADVKLYKASGELLSELRAKLPLLVRNPRHDFQGIRNWVVETKVTNIVTLLDRFQEWPQLLDPYLADDVQVLVNAFLKYCTSEPSIYCQKHGHQTQVVPLPRAIARVLYAYCKVRGQKIIVRLLNNEPKYIEPLLSCFRLWGYSPNSGDDQLSNTMSWEERYIMLLWLSHLMLAPFSLSSISGLATDSRRPQFADLDSSLPRVALNLLDLAIDHLHVSSKAREAASLLLVRLALRGDMQSQALPHEIVSWAIKEVKAASERKDTSEYYNIGLLSLMFGMANSSSDSESIPFVQMLLTTIHEIADPDNKQYEGVRDQAAARKLVIKIMRACLLHMIAITSGQFPNVAYLDVDQFLETSIQLLLDLLADKDTPVRQAASKALSLVCLRLDSDMSREVIEAVLSCLDENVFLENIATGHLIPITDLPAAESSEYRKNIGAVDSLKWHGAMLTLGHLLFQRAPPPDQLPSIIEALLIGLEFEQRSNVGTSIGVSVRDAACFGIWSLARKYSTQDMAAVAITMTMLPQGLVADNTDNVDVIQAIAIRLVISACLDPSGNIRRGSSAALQELIGRHPDVVPEGISVVQIVDYHAIARRSRAIEEVALSVSKLDDRYHCALQYALLFWSGARATHTDSRRLAAGAVGQLFSSMPQTSRKIYLQYIWSQISGLRTSNVGGNAAARHGLLLSLAHILDEAASSFDTPELQAVAEFIAPWLKIMSTLTGSIDGRITTDIENVLEAVASFFAGYASLLHLLLTSAASSSITLQDQEWAQPALSILDRCTVLVEKEFVIQAAARANVALFRLLPNSQSLIESWLDPKAQKKADFACKGRIVTFSVMIQEIDQDGNTCHRELLNRIISYFCHIVQTPGYAIETKTDAVHGIKGILASPVVPNRTQLHQLVEAIKQGMSDYTIDRRGDIGSLLRSASVETAQLFAYRDLESTDSIAIQKSVIKLAAEKMTKIRFQAWNSLKAFLTSPQQYKLLMLDEEETQLILELVEFEHQADVSSSAYYENLLQFLHSDQLRGPLILGLISSVAAGTEDISRASTNAIVTAILKYDESNGTRSRVIHSMLVSIIDHLVENAGNDDREVIPMIDFYTFLLEQLVVPFRLGEEDLTDISKVWNVVQKIHAPASTIQRLEALVRLYSCMLNLSQLRALALDRMTRLLLHKWPKIRFLVASAIFLHANIDAMLNTDWHSPAVSNKETVVQLRKMLKVS